MNKDPKQQGGDEPLNPRLWALTVNQAKARFRVYPSPAAAHWVHQTYVQRGGKFGSVKQLRPGDKKYRDEHEAKKDRDNKGRKGHGK